MTGEGWQGDQISEYRGLRVMRTTQAILEMVHNRGENGLPLKRMYRLLYNRNLYVTAYGNLYSNKGALTPGTDPNDKYDGPKVN